MSENVSFYSEMFALISCSKSETKPYCNSRDPSKELDVVTYVS